MADTISQRRRDRLSRFFPGQPEHCLEAISLVGGAITGSWATELVLSPTEWQPNDLDVVVPGPGFSAARVSSRSLISAKDLTRIFRSLSLFLRVLAMYDAQSGISVQCGIPITQCFCTSSRGETPQVRPRWISWSLVHHESHS